jgi:serine/threonine protein kinase
MEISELNEAFVNDDDGDITFSHTKVIAKEGHQYYYGITKLRCCSSEIDPYTLSLFPIPASQIWPLFPTHFTRAPEPLPQSLYVKQHSLLHYGDTAASTNLGTLLLHEARICEILRANPHPNIAKYHGCVVDEEGRITGLCFTKYGVTLSQRVKDSRPFDRKLCLSNIHKGVEHMHMLGLIHCDINPNNILMDGDNPVISDFDSSQENGNELGLKGGTKGWTRDEFKFATGENDLYGLSKIEEYLFPPKTT